MWRWANPAGLFPMFVVVSPWKKAKLFANICAVCWKCIFLACIPVRSAYKKTWGGTCLSLVQVNFKWDGVEEHVSLWFWRAVSAATDRHRLEITGREIRWCLDLMFLSIFKKPLRKFEGSEYLSFCVLWLIPCGLHRRRSWFICVTIGPLRRLRNNEVRRIRVLTRAGDVSLILCKWKFDPPHDYARHNQLVFFLCQEKKRQKGGGFDFFIGGPVRFHFSYFSLEDRWLLMYSSCSFSNDYNQHQNAFPLFLDSCFFVSFFQNSRLLTLNLIATFSSASAKPKSCPPIVSFFFFSLHQLIFCYKKRIFFCFSPPTNSKFFFLCNKMRGID